MKTFDVCILRRLSRLDVNQLDLPLTHYVKKCRMGSSGAVIAKRIAEDSFAPSLRRDDLIEKSLRPSLPSVESCDVTFVNENGWYFQYMKQLIIDSNSFVCANAAVQRN